MSSDEKRPRSERLGKCHDNGPADVSSTGSKPRRKFYGEVMPRSPMIEVLRQTVKRSRLQRLEEILAARCGSVQVLLENIQDPHNGAVCLRTADAFGICYVNVVEHFVPFSWEVDVAAGANEYVEIRRFSDCLSATSLLKREGFVLVVTTLEEGAVPFEEVEFLNMDKICLVFGNEERGVSTKLLESADYKVFLPMVGMVQSFNVSVTFSQCLYYLNTLGRIKADLSQDELFRIYMKWIFNNSSNPKKIVEKHKFDYPML
eukprot:Plantae.Rhodophyta-Purpureofilum_apyrenoidigerum.ctg13653.p1 GENE.Plantae.Rhodophyta-Purpureofilum_apyrenoidigerum.ctg13653~~Plantae.Rhodophyta-Purpureofilum_apyrenoidigerum.ctg13653.p1  ORF type:complete len:260 (+),score=37.93 Plantae.Rhodophyta-Purpureofilum_apyrenoidigerum.ctg13653:124-903(+)